MKQTIVIRNYKTEDYRDLIRAGYPFSTTLLGRSFRLKKKLLETMEQLERRLLVAYSLDEKRAVGLVTLKEITRNLWGIWDIFVSPTHRGRRISSLLYKASYGLLREKGVGKAVGSVEATNIASIKSIERNWDGFLSPGFYKYYGRPQNIQGIEQKGLIIRNSTSPEKIPLFELYRQCAGKDWPSFLEVNVHNFLDRFIQYPCGKGLLKIFTRKEILIAEKRGLIVGYILVFTQRQSRNETHARLYSFLSYELSATDAIGLINEAFKLMLRRRFSNIHVYSLSVEKQRARHIADELVKEFGLSVSKNLVTIKKL